VRLAASARRTLSGVRAWRAAAAGWALYDFAYSAFSFLLLVRFFPTWIINDLGRPDWYVTLTQGAVVLVVLATMPLAGAYADQTGRRKPLLVVFTVLAACAAAVLGVLPVEENILPVLVVAAVSAIAAQLALAQYDPLLGDVAPEEARGRVSGWAVSLGFCGIVFGLVVVAELVVGESSKQRAFMPAALLYLVFALPAFILVREQVDRGRRGGRHALRRAWAQFGRSFEQVRAYPKVFRFLGARLLYSDAIATLSAFLAVYMTRLGGFSERDKNLALGIVVLAAGIGAVAAGRLVERHGPKLPLMAVLPAIAGCVFVTAAVGEPWTIWALSPVAGCSLGVVWTADRVFMLLLTPRALRGQFFGFFNLANRVASAIGPILIWSGTIWVLNEQAGWLDKLDASRVALALLALAALVGWLVLRPLPSSQPRDEEATVPAPA
jgi:UMF1 family MFS transporter